MYFPPWLAVSGSGHTGNKINSLKLSQVCKSASQAVLSRMHPTLNETRRTPHGASRLVQAMPPWSGKTRRAPSRHSRDARVYGHTTTAMREYRVHPPPGSLAYLADARNAICSLFHA